MYAIRNSTHRMQRLVWLTLLAWSFALASGIANACVLSLSARAAGASSPPAQMHAHEHEPGSAGQDSCLKFCDDESSALAKSTSYAADLGAALVDPRLERRLAVPPLQADPGAPLEPPRAQGPPLVIRFLRLTL